MDERFSEQVEGRKIGLLGGSFNPAHQGHREISLIALKQLGLNEVWWLVTPGNPLKDASIYEEYAKRLRQADAIADHDDIHISSFENDHNLTYTFDTLTKIKTTYPHHKFVWLMGGDSLENFHQWRDWEKIFSLVPIAILNRPDHEKAPIKSVAAMQFSKTRIPLAQAKTLVGMDAPAWVFLPQSENTLSSTALRTTPQNMGEPQITSSSQAPTSAPEEISRFVDFHPPSSNFREDVITGLSASRKSLSPKYFYDERGSSLFARITQTKDYYPTRTELALMQQNLPDIKKAIGPNAAIFEYGSGASEKIRLLIENLDHLQTYVAMDISKAFLLESAKTLALDYPEVTVSAICADFQQDIDLSSDFHPEVKRWTGYFPGSTIGNFAPGTVSAFFKRVSATLGTGARFLLGFDLVKDTVILNRAYNDSEGITADFNMNLLHRMKQELGADVTIEDFAHKAFYNEAESRIEMHLQANRETQIQLEHLTFEFKKGETLHTEYSYKYTRDSMEVMLEDTPWSMSHYWTDEQGWFGACLLSNS